MGVKVTVDTAKVGDRATLFVVLHRDGGLQNIFEWGRGRAFNDPAAFENGQYISAAFSGLDSTLEDSAQDLGARPLRVLFTVTLPLITPAILTATPDGRS
jgi:hypothetical protein